MTEVFSDVTIYINGKSGLMGVIPIEPWVLDPLENPRQEEGKPVQFSEAAVTPKTPDSGNPPENDFEDLNGVVEGTTATLLGS